MTRRRRMTTSTSRKPRSGERISRYCLRGCCPLAVVLVSSVAPAAISAVFGSVLLYRYFVWSLCFVECFVVFFAVIFLLPLCLIIRYMYIYSEYIFFVYMLLSFVFVLHQTRNRKAFEDMGDAAQLRLRGFPQGRYIRIRFKALPAEFVTNFR